MGGMLTSEECASLQLEIAHVSFWSSQQHFLRHNYGRLGIGFFLIVLISTTAHSPQVQTLGS